ncbi:hypothetical protein NQ318_003207 [Aromia moschata]|uniref:Uncharacterized protein n=1 Tax=Aromia moschata TaxID=1265417 RepID=A0AAV8XKP4_9CUCU|nr:hypothetical protein NQ318_003207 [Aromia moschata]
MKVELSAVNWYSTRADRDDISHTIVLRKLSVDEEDEILILVSENPGLKTRQSMATGLRQSSICRIFKKEMLHPCHYTSVQQLLPQDLPARLQFAISIKYAHRKPIFS